MSAHRPITRRVLLAGAVSGISALALSSCTPAPEQPTAAPALTPTPTTTTTRRTLDLSDLPAATYAVWGSLGPVTVEHAPDTRMRMCSTVKLVVIGRVLDARAAGAIGLDDVLTWDEEDLIGHSPVTRATAGMAATVADLAAAAGIDSDNTATNLLIDHVGGLPALQSFARGLGDQVTRFDRYETAMNMRDGDLDTTTAAAFAGLALSMRSSLAVADRDILTSWLPDRTDGRRIASVAPEGVELAHKTGTSGDGAFNDVAYLRAGGRDGCLAIFTDTPGSESDEVVAEIARRAFEEWEI